MWLSGSRIWSAQKQNKGYMWQVLKQVQLPIKKEKKGKMWLMCLVREAQKKKNKAWHLTKIILSFYYQKIKNKNRTEGGEKKGRRRRKGLRPPVSCDVDSGYLVSISTNIFVLSFFFLTGRFPFSCQNTPIFSRYDPIRPKSTHIGVESM